MQGNVPQPQKMAARKPVRFPRFRDLPAELRSKIWEEKMKEPRFIALRSIIGHKIMTRGPTYLVTVNLPALLHTCQESRSEITRYYSVHSKNCLAAQFWMNFDIDTVCFFGSWDLRTSRTYRTRFHMKETRSTKELNACDPCVALEPTEDCRELREASAEVLEKVQYAAIRVAPRLMLVWDRVGMFVCDFLKKKGLDLVILQDSSYWIDLEVDRPFRPEWGAERGMKNLVDVTVLVDPWSCQQYWGPVPAPSMRLDQLLLNERKISELFQLATKSFGNNIMGYSD